ncbi:competence protein, partial [Francisella tularensis subsp. holarctica]|nr:competence protein [Francisella tularensis subsp. holarctica]
IFDTQNQMVLVQDQGNILLYTAAKNLANEYLLSNVLESYLRFAGIKQIDYIIIVDGKKNLNLKLIRQLMSIKTGITILST